MVLNTEPVLRREYARHCSGDGVLKQWRSFHSDSGSHSSLSLDECNCCAIPAKSTHVNILMKARILPHMAAHSMTMQWCNICQQFWMSYTIGYVHAFILNIIQIQRNSCWSHVSTEDSNSQNTFECHVSPYACLIAARNVKWQLLFALNARNNNNHIINHYGIVLKARLYKIQISVYATF